MKFSENVTLLTCSFNNNFVTKMMLMSFFKKMPIDIPVVIMDNGTKEFCDNELTDFFTVIDNHNNKLSKNQDGPSQNHCASIDYALKNIIKTKYVLLCDNDILFKDEIKHFFDFLDTFEEIDAIGQVGYDRTPPDRLFPYFCVINVEKFKEQKLNYFDKKRILGANWRASNRYDTGYSFYQDIMKKKWKLHKIIMTKSISTIKQTNYHNNFLFLFNHSL